MAEGRGEITSRLFRTRAEHEAADAAYWQALSPEERLNLTWRLSEELWRLRGEFPDEPGILRTVARVIRPC